jgi:Domain of unknown function (DUF4214)/Glycosyl hydrolase catalytic core
MWVRNRVQKKRVPSSLCSSELAVMTATRLIAIALCAAIAILTGRAQAASPQPDIIWGANGHPLSSYPGVSIEAQLDAVRNLGMRSYRVDITDTTHISGLRAVVQAARARAITVLPVVTPQFDLAKESTESLEKKAHDLAFALVLAFRGQIPVWELGNEMENYAIIQPCEEQDDGKLYSCSYGPAGGVTSLEYFGARWAKVSAVLKGMSRGAHDADPSVRRALGTAGWGHIGAFERMKADGIEWDISVWHMYGEDPEWAFKQLVKYGKPIWVTEFNHPEGSTKSMAAQAQGLTRAMAQLSDLQGAYGIEAAHVYELLDEPYWKDYEAHMGLVTLKKAGEGKWTLGETKPAYAAIKAVLKGGEAPRSGDVAIVRRCALQPAETGATLPVQAVVTYAYCLALGRDPDGGGLNGWSAHLEKGMPIEKILADMLQSDEVSQFYDVPQLSTRDYIALMHRLLFDAEPAEPLLARAMTELNGGKPRADLLAELIGSKAFKQHHPTLFAKLGPKPDLVAQAPASVVARSAPQAQRNCDLGILSRPLQFERGQVTYSYCLVLGRWPDGWGLVSWTADRKKGLSLESFLTGLLQSDEFAAKYEANTLDDAGFVTLIYRVLLDRDPDGPGLASYASGLQSSALSRQKVIESILASDEFRSKHEALFNAEMPEKSRAQVLQ